MKLRLALEWFLNPDHLPFIAGIDQGWFDEAGLEVDLIEPEDHYDGLASAAAGEVEFACNEPLHMIDQYRRGLRALGCFFETDGGILLRHSAVDKVLAGEHIRLASPVAGGVTDRVAVEILVRWFEQKHDPINPRQVRIEAAGFEHLKNLHAGYDGAWLCFANFEGVEADHFRIDADFITTAEVGLENFSALELFTGRNLLRDAPDAVARFTEIASRGAAACRDHPLFAREIWYRHTGEDPNELTDAIVDDTCSRLLAPLARDPEKWRPMWRQFRDLGLAEVGEAAFDELYL
ncbi:MAG: ABC transporter substrate-binding protein [Wenzhouxiangellaceae bacterium]|nr:ABC transporter substrate-binding protein [Wenzhouxiangellaceae bacterium]